MNVNYDQLLFYNTPRKSSPGIDGIPYEILSLVFKHPGVAPLAVKVYNEALLQSAFPSS